MYLHSLQGRTHNNNKSKFTKRFDRMVFVEKSMLLKHRSNGEIVRDYEVRVVFTKRINLETEPYMKFLKSIG